MENKFHQYNCGKDDVLSFGATMLKVDKLREEIEALLDEYKLGEGLTNSLGAKNIQINVPGESRSRNHYHRCYEKWFGYGIDCEILKLRAEGWQKGKIRIKLNVSMEFCPNEPSVEETQASNKTEISLPLEF